MRALVLISIIFSWFSLGAMAGEPGTKWITGDFFVIRSGAVPTWNAATTTADCRAHIRERVCLADPAGPHDSGVPEDRPCLPGSSAYASLFESLYDAYPPELQRMFCSLRRIFVERNLEATAYAGNIQDAHGASHGAVIGVRQSIIDDQLSFDQWASWKEELSFGGDQKGYHLTPGLPRIQALSPETSRHFFYYVFAHEFGHLFDFANHLNRCAGTAADSENCQVAAGSWSALSWVTPLQVAPADDFAGRSSLCFYSCNGKFIDRAMLPALYQGFAQSSFLSTYASTEMWDDFAESVAGYMSDKYLGFGYNLEDGVGHTYDISEKLHSERFRPKYEYIESFFRRTDIQYP